MDLPSSASEEHARGPIIIPVADMLGGRWGASLRPGGPGLFSCVPGVVNLSGTSVIVEVDDGA